MSCQQRYDSCGIIPGSERYLQGRVFSAILLWHARRDLPLSTHHYCSTNLFGSMPMNGMRMSMGLRARANPNTEAGACAANDPVDGDSATCH